MSKKFPVSLFLSFVSLLIVSFDSSAFSQFCCYIVYLFYCSVSWLFGFLMFCFFMLCFFMFRFVMQLWRIYCDHIFDFCRLFSEDYKLVVLKHSKLFIIWCLSFRRSICRPVNIPRTILVTYYNAILHWSFW